MSTEQTQNLGPSNSHLPKLDETLLEFDLIDFLRFSYGHRKFLLIFSAIVFISSFIYAFFISKPIFRSHATISINFSSKQQSISLTRITNWVDEQEMLNKITVTEKAFNSEGFQRALLAEVEGRGKYCQEEKRCKLYSKLIRNRILHGAQDVDSKIGRLFANLDLFSDTGKYLLTIQGTADHPDVALALTDIAALTLVEMNYETLLDKNSRLKKFIEDQTEETRIHLEHLETEMVHIQRENDLIIGPDTKDRISAIYIEQQNKLNELYKERGSAENLIRRLRADLQEIRTRIAADENPSFLYLGELQKRFSLLQYQKELNQSERNPSSEQSDVEIEPYRKVLRDPNTKLITTDPWEHIRKMETMLIEAQQAREKSQSEIDSAKSVISDLSAKTDLLPEVFRKVSELQRNISVTNELYGILKTRLQETRIQEAERANDLSVLANAERPLAPSGMSPFKRIFVAGLAGPAGALLLLLLYYLLIPTVRGTTDLERVGIRVVGQFLQFKEGTETHDYPVVLDISPDGYMANSIRYARFKLEQILGLDTREVDRFFGKVVTLSSTASAEGKSFSAANIGVAMAAVNHKVLILDLDIGKQDIRNYFSNLESLRDQSLMPTDDLVVEKFQVRPNLTLVQLSFPKKNHLSFLESPNFTSLLESFKEEYDLIIIDSPPIDGHLEPFILGRYADAVLFVINQRAALKDETMDSFSRIREATNGPILGILNFTLEHFSFLKKRKAA